MPTTTNYGWTTPADTDLVKDGAAAIRTLGSSVDSTLKTQIDNTVASSIQKTLTTTTGDVIYASAANTPARLGIGTTGQVLSVSGGLPVWATSAAGGMTSLATGTLSGVEVSLTSINQSYKNLYLVIKGATINTSTTGMGIRLNNVTTATYNSTGFSSSSMTGSSNAGLTVMNISTAVSGLTTTSTSFQQTLLIHDYSWAAGYKNINFTASNTVDTSFGNGYANTTAAITSLQMRTQNGTSTFTAGTYTLYGVN
jgi:hypothetical protein